MRMYEFSCTCIYLCIRACIFAEQSLYKGTFAVGVSFFGQRVKVHGCDSCVVGICKQTNGSQNLKMTELLILQLMKTTHFSNIRSIILSLS